MNTPPSRASREASLLLLNAYLDNELDAASVLDIEQRIASDAALKTEYDRLLQLRASLTSSLTRKRASEALRQRVAAIGEPHPAARLRPARKYDWRQLAAAALAAAFLASGTTYLSFRQSTPTSDIAAIVAGHQRALLAAAPFDIASSDRHTVKPWFDSKLALSPRVVDLSNAGFPLAGGRIDVVDSKTVPTMVYRRRQHVISVLAIPHAGSKENSGAPTRETRDGYSVFRWDGRDFQYAAVSDLAENELEEFVARWRADASTKPQ